MDLRGQTVEHFTIALGELEVRRADVLLDVHDTFTAGDRHDPGPAGEEPRECDLRWGRVMVGGDVRNDPRELHVVSEMLGRDAWQLPRAADVTRLELTGRCQAAAEQSPPQRRV